MQIEAIEPGEGRPVAKQIFKPSSWLNKLETISRLALASNVIIAILAERAAGKTTFANMLQSELESSIKTYVIKATNLFSQTRLLTQLDTIFHFNTEAEISLAKLVSHINEQKTHVLIVVDDAHYLPNSFLQEAAVELKQQGEEGFFHLCLISDSSYAANLSKLEADSIQILDLGVFTESETRTYILNCLPPKILDKTMTEKRLKQFYQLTEGNIARINSYMKDYFCPKLENIMDKRGSTVRNVSFLAIATVALIASSYLWQNQFLPSNNAFADEGYEEPELFAEISQPLPSLLPMIPQIEREPILVSQLPNINYELANGASQIPGWLISAVRQQVQPSPRRIVDVSLEEEHDDSLVVRDRVVVIPKTLPLSKPAAKAAAIVPPQPSARKIKNAKPLSTKPYTIQLLASRKREAVMQFVSGHQMDAKVKIRLTQRDGLEWYVLTLGEYSRREQAQAALKNLPEEFAQLKPWVRPTEQLKMLG